MLFNQTFFKKMLINNFQLNGIGSYISSKCSESRDQQVTEIFAGDKKFRLNNHTHVYEVNGRPAIWLYWHKNDMPVFAKILAESIQCVNSEFDVIIVHDSTVKLFWPEYPKEHFHKLTPNHRSDVIRANLLRIYGGIYMDIDTFPLQSFKIYYDMLPKYDMIGADWSGLGPIAVGHLGPARSGLLFFKMLSEWQMHVLEAKKDMLLEGNVYPFEWAELQTWMVIPLSSFLIKHKLFNYYVFHGQSTVGQLVQRGLESKLMTPLSEITPSLQQLQETPLLYIHHSSQSIPIDDLNVEQLLMPENVFSYFIKCSLKMCSRNVKNDLSIDEGEFNISLIYHLASQSFAYQCYNFTQTVLPQIKVKL